CRPQKPCGTAARREGFWRRYCWDRKTLRARQVRNDDAKTSQGRRVAVKSGIGLLAMLTLLPLALPEGRKLFQDLLFSLHGRPLVLQKIGNGIAQARVGNPMGGMRCDRLVAAR